MCLFVFGHFQSFVTQLLFKMTTTLSFYLDLCVFMSFLDSPVVNKGIKESEGDSIQIILIFIHPVKSRIGTQKHVI